VSKYGEILDSMDQEQQQKLAAVSEVASQFNPDQYAQALTQSAQTGVPAATIAQVAPGDKPRSKYGALLDSQDAPVTHEWLSNIDNAAVAQDDVERLSLMERILVSLGDDMGIDRDKSERFAEVATRLPGNTARSAVAQAKEMAFGTARMLSDLDANAQRARAESYQHPIFDVPAEQQRAAVDDAVNAYTQSRLASAQSGVKAAQANQEGQDALPQDAGFIERGIQQGVSSAIVVAPAMLAMGPEAALPLMGLGTGGARYSELIDKGLTQKQAATSAALIGSMEVLTEYLPGETLVKNVPGFWKHAAEFMATELPGENISSLTQLLDDYRLGLRDDVTFSDVLSTVEDTTLATVFGGVTQVSVGHALQKLAERTNERSKGLEAAQSVQQSAQDLSAVAQQSALATRSPEKLEELVSKIKEQTGSEHAYVDAEAFRTLFQSDQEAAQAAKEMTGSDTTYYEAAVSGSRMAIPLEKYVTRIATNKQAQSLLDHVTFSPDGLTLNEAKAASKEVEQRASEVQSEAPEAAVDTSQSIYDDVIGQLLQTGMERSTAEKNALLTQSVFRTLAKRTGMDAQDLYQRYGLKVQRDIPGLTPGRASVAVDPLLDRIRNGDIPSEQQTFGTSMLEFIRSKGGLKDEGGELAARDIDQGGKAFQRNIIQKNGLSLDDMAERLVEAGYIQERDPNLVLDLISKELSGSPTYAVDGMNSAKADQRTQIAWLEEMMSRAGIDIKTADNETIKRALDLGERGHLLDYLPSVDELTEEGLSGVDDAFDAAAVARAAEIDGALVPEGTSQKAIDVLEKAGIQWTYYSKSSEGAGGLKPTLDLLTKQIEQNGKQVLFQRFNETKRGAIQFGADRQFTISLLEKADLSTFLHESGHFYLEILGDLASDASAPQQIKDDFASVMKWMGVKSRADIGVEQHEQWARGFEAYLMDGKAPSVELQSVFARFRAWLVGVYRTIAKLNVNLTDDVRRVMDRLVATDDEIAAVEESQNYAPIFTSAEQAGMSPEEWAVYKDIATRAHQESVEDLTDRAMKELSREQKAWWKEERAKTVDAVTTEVNQQPVYRALAFLQKGTEADGSALPEGVEAAKLSKPELVERYGKDFVKRLPRGTTAADGLSADVVGQMFGYDSGQALVESLVNARPKTQLIEMEADARMRETHGDMLTDGSIAEKAMKSVHSDARAKVMAAELKALNKKRREVGKFVRAAEKQSARETNQAREANAASLPDADELRAIKLAASRAIAAKKVRDIQPNLYRMAESKAARKAFDLAGKGKFEEAYIEKRKQILNHEIYREAVKAREEVDRIREYMRSFDRKPTRERLAKAKGQYLEQIDALRARFDFTNVSNIADLQRTSLLQWVAEQEAAGREITIPESLLNEARRTPYKELMLAELQGLHDAVKNIDHLARTKDRLLKNKAAAEFQDAKGELLERIENQGGKAPPVSKFEQTKMQEYGALANEIVDSWLRPETIIEWLDGGESGPWHDYLMEPANNAEYKREQLREQVLKPLVNLAEKVSKKRRNELHEEIQIKSLGRSFNRRTLLSIVLNMGNESNLERLTKGGFREGSQVRQFTPQALNEILTKLNAADIEFLNTAWSTVEQLWPEVAEFQKRMGGLVPEKIKAAPLKAPAGELTGGYWPVVYDSLATRAGQSQAASSDPVQTIMGANFTRATTSKGHTKGRTAVAGPLLLDYAQVAGRHTEQVITDLTHREFAMQAMKILDDSDMRLKLQDAMGETAWKSLRGMVLHSVQQDGGYSDAANRGQERIMRRLLSNTAVAALGFRAVTAWGNMVLAPMQAGARIAPKYIATGLGKFYRHPIDATKFIHDASPMMKSRSKNMDHTLNVVMQTLQGQRGFRAKVAQASMAMHSTADHLATHGLWLGRYQQALDEGGTHDEAVRLADKAIRQTQTAGAPKDLSAFERDPRYAWFKMFLGPMLIQGNRIRESLKRRGVVKNWPQAFGTMMAAWFLPAVMWDLMSGRGPDDKDDDGIADDAASWSLRKIFFYPFMTMPFIRDAASIVERKMSGQYAEPRMTPLADAALLTWKAGDSAWKETSAWLDGDEFNAENVMKSSLRASGPLFGLPTNQLDVTGSYMWDLYTGDAELDGVGDLRYLLVRP
jgi:hypothetical protein